MIAFEVSVDGQKACTAGVPTGVTTAIRTWVRRGPSENPEEELSLTVSGLIHEPGDVDLHVGWLDQPLTIGSEISIRIIEADSADTPAKSRRFEPDFVERSQRAHYERMKRKYGDT